MEHMYYDVRFMFVHHSYCDGEIELCEGVTAFVDEDEFYESVKLFESLLRQQPQRCKG
jgi:hypothetical protein